MKLFISLLINTCSKLLTNKISKTYKNTEHIYNKISKEVTVIANNYGVSERVDSLAKSNASISLKDHKPNFSSSPIQNVVQSTLQKAKLGKLVNNFFSFLRSEVYYW